MAPSTVAALLAALLPSEAQGHGWVTEPPARNAVGGVRNGYCPHCGNGAGICGDGNQWPATSDYLNYYTGPVATWTAGSVVEVEVKITAHHLGHFEFSICDQKLDSSVQQPQACLNQHILERASPAEAGFTDCGVDDARAGCQPLDFRHPERFYLPPKGTNGDVHAISLKVPTDVSCAECTLQWRWWSANSCISGPDYGCFRDDLAGLGWDAPSWGLGTNSCPGGGRDRESGCGEEFRNCVDIVVQPSSGPTFPPASTVTTTAAVTTTTAAPSGRTCLAAASAFGASDAECMQVCNLLPEGQWPCGGADELCDCSRSSSTTASSSSTTTTASSGTGTTTCVPNPDLPITIGTPSESACDNCANGYEFWPCSPEQGYDLCVCSESLAQSGQKLLRPRNGAQSLSP